MKICDAPPELLAAVSYQMDQDVSWKDPEPVQMQLLDVAPFTKSMLPKILQKRVYDITERMHCPVDFVAVATIVMLGSVIGSGCAIRPKQKDDWAERPNLWGGIVSPPGKLKSPATAEAFKPYSKLEKNAGIEHADSLRLYNSDKIGREIRLKMLKQQQNKKGAPTTLTTGSSVLEEMMDLSQEVKPPTIKRYRTQDATIEKLAELNSANPRGLLVQRDELVGLLSLLSREDHQGDRAFYLEAWNGSQSYTQDRIGRGTIVVDTLCLSVFGSIQPTKLQNYMYGVESGQNDGLMQRFQLLVYPDSVKWQLIDELPDKLAQEAVTDIVFKLAKCSFLELGAKFDPPDGPRYYRYEASVQSQVNQWLIDLEQLISTEENGIIAEHLSKYRKLVPALSLIFHLVDVVASDKPHSGIKLSSFRRSLLWATYLESHARRIYGLATDYVLLSAESLAKKIKAGELNDGFTERDVYRKGWSYLDEELTHPACKELVELGWLKQIKVQSTVGKPNSPSYQINPKLKI